MRNVGDRIGQGALRRLILSLAPVAIGLASPAAAETRTFTISSFDVLRVEAPVRVTVATGLGVSARGDGDARTLDRLRVELSGRVLTVRMQPGQDKAGNTGPATLRLATGALQRIVVIGGGSVAIDRMKGLRADINVGGNGDVAVAAVDLDRLDVALAGGGAVTLAGKAGEATLRLSGPGQIAAEGLIARQATLTNDGAGNIVAMAQVAARVTSSGSGSVTVSGKPACTAKNSGTGQIVCGEENY